MQSADRTSFNSQFSLRTESENQIIVHFIKLPDTRSISRRLNICQEHPCRL